jgi:hypothetical protein
VNDDPLTDGQIAALVAHQRFERVHAACSELCTQSRGLRMLATETRETLAGVFLDVVDGNPEANYDDPHQVAELRREFRQRCKRHSGVPLGVIVLFLNIAWNIFWHWWTRRDRDPRRTEA